MLGEFRGEVVNFVVAEVIFYSCGGIVLGGRDMGGSLVFLVEFRSVSSFLEKTEVLCAVSEGGVEEKEDDMAA